MKNGSILSQSIVDLSLRGSQQGEARAHQVNTPQSPLGVTPAQTVHTVQGREAGAGGGLLALPSSPPRHTPMDPLAQRR